MKILNRAKSIHSDYYPIGEWLEYEGRCFIIETKELTGFEVNAYSEPFSDGMLDGEICIQDFIYEVQLDTRSLSFPDMIDSEGNKIFASLQEDGKGGDSFVWDNETFVVWFDSISLSVYATNKDNFESNCHDTLQEWYSNDNKYYDLKTIKIQE